MCACVCTIILNQGFYHHQQPNRNNKENFIGFKYDDGGDDEDIENE